MKKTLQKISLIFILMASLSACTFVSKSTKLETNQRNLNNLDRQMKTIYLDDKPMEVEVVFTAASTAQGLSGRSEIGAEGMLFVFPNKQPRRFWMKEMKFDLDIIWIQNNKVVGITKNVPAPSPGISLSELELYPSPESVDIVLEVVSGDAEKRNITVGSKLETSF